MRKTFSIVAIAALSAFAGSPNFGGMASGALVVSSMDASGMTTNMGFGGKVAGTVEYPLQEKIALAANAGYMLATWGYEFSNPFGKSTVDGTSHFVSLDAGANFAAMDKLKVFGGLGVDIPVSGSVTTESTMTNPFAALMGGEATITEKETEDIKDSNTEFLLVAGAGYKLTEKIGVDARYRFALTEYGTKFKLSELLVGATYAF